MGCGPSIKNQDLSRLENEIVIGVNHSYKICDKYNIKFKYYTVCDYGNTWKSDNKEIINLNTILFLGDLSANDYFKNIDYYKNIQKSEVILLKKGKEIISDNEFEWKNKNILDGFLQCVHTPAAFTLPLMYHLGFKEVYLIGIDMNYLMKDNYFYGSRIPNRKMFDTSYYERSSKEFGGIGKAFENANRKVYNATLGGNLNTLERKSLDEIKW